MADSRTVGRRWWRYKTTWVISLSAVLMIAVVGLFTWGSLQPRPTGFAPSTGVGGLDVTVAGADDKVIEPVVATVVEQGPTRYTVDAVSRADWVLFDFDEGRGINDVVSISVGALNLHAHEGTGFEIQNQNFTADVEAGEYRLSGVVHFEQQAATDGDAGNRRINADVDGTGKAVLIHHEQASRATQFKQGVGAIGELDGGIGNGNSDDFGACFAGAHQVSTG